MSAERLQAPERDPRTRFVVVTTGTMYPNWYDGPLRDPEHDVDKVRGDLALQTISEANRIGFRTIVIDGGSSMEFRHALAAEVYKDDTLGSMVYTQTKKGMSAGRVEGFGHAASIRNNRVIAWVEPEKVSFIGQILTAAGPILDDTADIVIPARDDTAFASYPPLQAELEQRANATFNKLLKRAGLRKKRSPDLDMWFGPRLFRDKMELYDIFAQSYKYLGKHVGKKDRFKLK